MRNSMVARKPRSIEKRKSRNGFLFILPWVIGVVLFFALPIVQSILYSFSSVKLQAGSLDLQWVGLKQYIDILNNDATYVSELWAALGQMAYSLPVIIVVSLILALVLNSRFRGRFVFRGLFFLPVIIAAGVVLGLLFQCLSGNAGQSAMAGGGLASAGGAGATMAGNIINFEVLLNQLNLPASLNSFVSSAIGNIFDLIWNCGIQVVLFVAGLQSIPQQLYEVSTVEGASKWEEFWFITLPLMSRVLMLVVVFTVIELLTSTQNPVIRRAYSLVRTFQYDLPSAMMWFYFIIVGVVLAIIMGLFGRLYRRWE